MNDVLTLDLQGVESVYDDKGFLLDTISSDSSDRDGFLTTILEQPTEESVVSPNYHKLKDHFNRLVIVSWKIRQYGLLLKALKNNVAILRYKNDASFSSILQSVEDLLCGDKMISVAMLTYGSPGNLIICHDKVLSLKTLHENIEIKQFFIKLVDISIDRSNPNSHFDFLCTTLDSTFDGQQTIQELQDYIRLPITTNKDIFGKDGERSNAGDLYFSPAKLRGWSGSGNQISNYEKIRILGRGAYGTAVLYRKKDDDSLVVLKEISLLELNVIERNAAMNEVKVLGMLSHPNIISYYDSFDEDGTLWIEMEYADGGTLADYLSKQENDMDERDILIIFSQMVSAIKYCHDHCILHRDLKTQNIFLTQEGKVKLGDFGIAKIINTHNMGNFTVVGTPYYISPEMCEGLAYDKKSDLWSLGCILYEMANLTKTFDGTNLPALITKIVSGTFAPIKETYSPEFRMLVHDILKKNPNLRPSAEDILFNRLPELLKKYADLSDPAEELSLNSVKTRSLLYYWDVSTMQLFLVKGLPNKIQITEVSVGLGHLAVISTERGIFTWGDNSFGQLGVGDNEPRNQPTEIESLRGKCVISVACGNYFTAFLTDNGLVLTCGQGEFGCLGHGDWLSINTPKLVDELMTLDITSLVAGSNHVAITTSDGKVYTWGCGLDGRTGHGTEDNICIPKLVSFGNEKVFIQNVQCSSNGTVFISDAGNLFACGSNQGNKLGLNPRQGFLYQFRSKSSKNIVEKAKVPTLVKYSCKYQISTMQFGTSHCTMMSVDGKVYTNGENEYGQLGCGNLKPRELLSNVKGLEEVSVTTIACGSSFSMAGIHTQLKEHPLNLIYFWGTKPQKRKKSMIPESNSKLIRKRNLSMVDESDQNFSTRDESEVLRNSSRTSMSEPNSLKLSLGVSSEKLSDIDDSTRKYLEDILKGFFSQTLNLSTKQGETFSSPCVVFSIDSISDVEGYEDEDFPVVLRSIYSSQHHVLIQFETNAPPPKTVATMKKSEETTYSIDEKTVIENFSEREEVPTWLQNELQDGIPLSSIKGSQPFLEEFRENVLKEKSPLVRSKSIISKRRSSLSNSKDPNFNLIPKIQRQGTFTQKDSFFQESKKVDGSKPQIVRDCSSPSDKVKHNVAANSSADVEYTPVERIGESINNEISSPKVSRSTDTKFKIKTLPSTKLREKKIPVKTSLKFRRNDIGPTISDSEDSEMRKEENKGKINQISKEGLVKEINKLKIEKEQREKELIKFHEEQLKEKDEILFKKEQEAKKREQELKEEILSLKADLNNQNSKLQDNYNILLSLQEQLLCMQQTQIRNVISTSFPRNDPPVYTKESGSKSSICDLM
ncbi:uncharacterized protein LOC100207375 isoform X1 [Hydra vulgaris]|uniref:uncharacterized protein LOC100207375 isoform X1 n=1 Tax=Hydra vulgaris TaxID=6087 RepID=UPI0032EA2247